MSNLMDYCACGRPKKATSTQCWSCYVDARQHGAGPKPPKMLPQVEKWCPHCKAHWRWPVPVDFISISMSPGLRRRLASAVEEFIEVAIEHGDYSAGEFHILDDFYWWIQQSIISSHDGDHLTPLETEARRRQRVERERARREVA